MKNDISTPWVLKYYPKSVSEMVLTEELMKMFSDIIRSGSISNYSFFGAPGCGKTTLSKLLVKELSCEYYFHPCSINGSIDVIKTTIKNFCEIIPNGKYKIIILDEADQLSKEAQMALRDIIVESMENCRFILTANYQDRIIDALKTTLKALGLHSLVDALEGPLTEALEKSMYDSDNNNNNTNSNSVAGNDKNKTEEKNEDL